MAWVALGVVMFPHSAHSAEQLASWRDVCSLGAVNRGEYRARFLSPSAARHRSGALSQTKAARLGAALGPEYPCANVTSAPGGMKDSRLVRLTLKNDRVTGEEHLLADRDQRVRDVRQGPDGAL